MTKAYSHKRRWPWLAVAALLFVAAAWLMAGSEEVKTNKVKKVSLPRSMTPVERARNTERLQLPDVVPGPEASPAVAPKPRDPVLAALPAEVKYGAMVIEANAIRHSDLGNLAIECIFTGRSDVLSQMQDAGFNPLENLNRVAISDNALMLSGDFSKADVPALMKTGRQRQFGANAELFARALPDGGADQRMGLWKGQVLVLGETEDDITTVLDRLDGKTDPGAKSVLTDADAYGEMYGVFKPGMFADELGEANPALARLEESASTIKLHADVSHDVGVVAQVEGADPTKTQDLRKALGSALTLARLQAEANGDKNAAEVLGFARVGQAKGDGANFHLEAGLPYEFLEKQLKKCVADRKARTTPPP